MGISGQALCTPGYPREFVPDDLGERFVPAQLRSVPQQLLDARAEVGGEPHSFDALLNFRLVLGPKPDQNRASRGIAQPLDRQPAETGCKAVLHWEIYG